MVRYRAQDAAFGYRVFALVVDGDKALLHRSEIDDFWSLPAGAVEIQETSAAAVKVRICISNERGPALRRGFL